MRNFFFRFLFYILFRSLLRAVCAAMSVEHVSCRRYQAEWMKTAKMSESNTKYWLKTQRNNSRTLHHLEWCALFIVAVREFSPPSSRYEMLICRCENKLAVWPLIAGRKSTDALDKLPGGLENALRFAIVKNGVKSLLASMLAHNKLPMVVSLLSLLRPHDARIYAKPANHIDYTAFQMRSQARIFHTIKWIRINSSPARILCCWLAVFYP